MCHKEEKDTPPPHEKLFTSVKLYIESKVIQLKKPETTVDQTDSLQQLLIKLEVLSLP